MESNCHDLNATLKLSVLKCFPTPTRFEFAHTQYHSLQPKEAIVGAKWG